MPCKGKLLKFIFMPKTIFPQEVTPQYLNDKWNSKMPAFLGIEYTEVGPDYLIAKMPVNEQTKQPMGILHGGASVVLAETVGSVAANIIAMPQGKTCVGLDINANHIKSAKEGYVFAKGTPVHLGGKTQVWAIEITNEEQQIVCVSRLTLAVLDKKQ
jgi:1,4-dihydroxy-2-naphthoyl-CoA hydrolase